MKLETVKEHKLVDDTFTLEYFNWDDGLYLKCGQCECVLPLGFSPSPFEAVGLANKHQHTRLRPKHPPRVVSEKEWGGAK